MSLQTITDTQGREPRLWAAVSNHVSESKGQGHDHNIPRSLCGGGCRKPPPVVFLNSFTMSPEAEPVHLFFPCYFQIRQSPHSHYSPSSSPSPPPQPPKSCPGNLNLRKSLSLSQVGSFRSRAAVGPPQQVCYYRRAPGNVPYGNKG